MTNRPPEPPPMICAICSESWGWWWDNEDSEWLSDSEWYKDPAGLDRFICSRFCYRDALDA